MKFSEEVGNGPVSKCLNFGGDPDHHLQYSDCFPDPPLLEDTESGINRLRCETLQCWAGIAIATMTSLRNRPLAEVRTVPALLVLRMHLFESDNLTRGKGHSDRMTTLVHVARQFGHRWPSTSVSCERHSDGARDLAVMAQSSTALYPQSFQSRRRLCQPLPDTSALDQRI